MSADENNAGSEAHNLAFTVKASIAGLSEAQLKDMVEQLEAHYGADRPTADKSEEPPPE